MTSWEFYNISKSVYKNEAVARLVRGEELIKIGGEQHQNKEIGEKLEEEELSQENNYS